MSESLASTRVSASMGPSTGHVIEDAAAQSLGLGGRAKANAMDPFEELLRQLRMFHQGEVQRLRDEVLSLQSQRLQTDMQAPSFLQKQTDAEVMEMAEAVAESQGMNNHEEKEEENALPTSLDSAASNPQQRTRSFADNNHDNEKGWELGKSKHVSNIRAKKSASVLDQVHKKHSQSSWRWDGDCRILLQRILRHPAIDCTMSFLIVCNALVFAFEAQYRGFEMAEALGFKRDEISVTAHELWPGAEDVFPVIEMFFGVIFTMEVVLRLYAERLHFFAEGWNWLDATVVIVWLFGKIWRTLPVNSQILRLGRLFRLLRMLRLVRRMKEFDALFLMTTAIRSSFMVLGWTIALLFVCQMLFALIVQQFLYGFYFDENADGPGKEAQLRVFEYFGTFTRALLSLFEMTLANWPPVCRLLMEEVSEWWMIFCLFHKLTMGFAVVGVINGVLMQETFKVAHMDDTVMVREKQRAMRTHVSKMSALFHDADTSGDGRLDIEEFKTILQHYEVKIWLAAMDLDVSDVEELFDMLDTGGDGRLSAEELVNGVSRLRGAARAMDMKRIAQVSSNLEHGLHDLATIKPMIHKIHRKHSVQDEDDYIRTEVEALIGDEDSSTVAM
ncbi:SCN4A [Symbiodinium sp. CCMP2456]|nr:SCN4A [Symbiodinium sp. CCMP2456]